MSVLGTDVTNGLAQLFSAGYMTPTPTPCTAGFQSTGGHFCSFPCYCSCLVSPPAPAPAPALAPAPAPTLLDSFASFVLPFFISSFAPLR